MTPVMTYKSKLAIKTGTSKVPKNEETPKIPKTL